MQTSQTILLARHFFWRFFDNDLVAPDSDAHQAASIAVAFVAVPGFLVSAFLFLRYGNPWIVPAHRLVISLTDKLQFISWSMMVMALATVVAWDTLALDARDYAILGPLPIPRRTLLAGKALAVASFIGVFALAANLSSIVLFPLAYLSSSHMPLAVGLWVMAGHGVACLGAALFAFCAVLTVRGIALNLAGPERFKRLSLAIQFALALLVVAGFLNVSVTAFQAGGARVFLSPPMWFLGLYQTIADGGVSATLDPAVRAAYGLTDLRVYEPQAFSYWPVLDALSRRAVTASALCLAAAALFYFASHFRHERHLRQMAPSGPARASAPRRLGRLVARRVLVRDPVAQAGYFFTLTTLARSARHKAYLACFLLVGCVLSFTTVASIAAARGTGVRPDAALFSVQVMLSCLLVVGLRGIFTVPADLRANWVFRLTTGQAMKRYLAGVRRAVAAAVLAPFFVALLPLHALLCGWPIAALHGAIGYLVALLTFDVLMLHFEKVPFTCARRSSGNVRMMWPAYLVAFGIYTSVVARVEEAALTSRPAWLSFLGVLLAALGAMSVYKSRLLARRTGFVFDEPPDAAVVALGL